MNEFIRHNFPVYFPLFFLVMWISVTTLLGVLSGWFVLMRAYPDRGEVPLQSFSWQSGSMNSVNMRSVLRVSLCPSGLRLGIMRLFGPFCLDFLVPWGEISIVRKDRFFLKVAQISLGRPAIGQLTISADVADRLARAAGSHWPETELVGPAPIPWTVFRLRRLMFWVFAYLLNLTPQGSLTPQAGEALAAQLP